MILRLLLLVIFISSINCKSIVNPHNFSYLHNPGYRVCKGDVYLLVYVHSSPGNYKRRTLIRETWASQMIFPQLRLVFMLGKSIESKVMKSISYESAVYHDIVQEDFIDAYKNLTYKGIMALKWTATYCERAKFVLKADDDILVNTYTMIRHLENLEKHMKSIKNTLFCLLWRSMPVLRDSDSKWYVSKDEFPMDEFPPYCSGSGEIPFRRLKTRSNSILFSAFILTNDMPKKMFVYLFIQKLIFIWFDLFKLL